MTHKIKKLNKNINKRVGKLETFCEMPFNSCITFRLTYI